MCSWLSLASFKAPVYTASSISSQENMMMTTTTMMLMVQCPKAGSLAFAPPGDEMSEVVSCCLQLWVSNLSKVTMQWPGVDSNLRPFGCKEQNIPLLLRIPITIKSTMSSQTTLKKHFHAILCCISLYRSVRLP